MKKIFVLACSVMLAGIVSASAQTKIYITGSTAFRSATHTGIMSAVTGATAVASDTGTPSSANAVNYTGTVGGISVLVKTSWSGSAAGIQTVAATSPALTVRFLPDAASGTTADPRIITNPADVATPDIALSDNYQGSCPFKGSFLGNSYATLTDKIVGVATFNWVASEGFAAYDTNVTEKELRFLFSSGAAPIALFNGNHADQDKVVYATGRNPDSGTRITALAESGLGGNAIVYQYKPTVTGGSGGKNGVITSVAPYPVETINGVPVIEGNSGENSGSSLRNFLTHTFDAGFLSGQGYSAGFFVSYLGVADADNVVNVTDGAVRLSYNGISFSPTGLTPGPVQEAEFDKVREGFYTFWGYEHLMYKAFTPGTTKATFVGLLETSIKSVVSVSPNVRFSTMQVSRPGDGATVAPSYF